MEEKIFARLYNESSDGYTMPLLDEFYYILFDFCKENCKNEEEIKKVLYCIDADLIEHYTSYFKYKNKIYHVTLDWVFEVKKDDKDYDFALHYVGDF